MERFSLENVTKHAAVFDLDKLNWMNSVYIRQADNKYLCSILEEILVRRGRIKPEEITPFSSRVLGKSNSSDERED